MRHESWQKEIVYQVYPRSFLDTNGDGIGDLPGIISKLDYLKDLGVTAVWLSPVFASPMRDNGYDISDYYSVDPLFGSNVHMETLISEAKKRGLRLILDLVVNHTSDLNQWFIEAKKSRDNPFRDYYVWRDEPNELSSIFGGSAWEKDPLTSQCYLHLFAKEQPDLNWANPKLRQEIYKMMNYWLDKGIGGFRMDVIENIGKEPDERIVANGPHLHEYIHEMNRATFGKRNAITIGECWSADDESRTLYTDPLREELSMVFQFEHITSFWDEKYGKWKKKPFDLRKIKNALFGHQLSNPDKCWNTLFWDNHDTTRALGDYVDPRCRQEGAKMLFGLTLFMSGTPFIYQGDEIGMINAGFTSMDEIKDIEAKNEYASLLEGGFSKEEATRMVLGSSRDNARTPMQWSADANGGFSTGVPWLRLEDDYAAWSAEAEEKNPSSVLSYYKKAIKIRKTQPNEDVILYGAFEPLYKDDERLFAYQRKGKGIILTVVANFSDDVVPNPLKNEGSILISNDAISNDTIGPYGFAVYENET
jgi:glycosidase